MDHSKNSCMGTSAIVFLLLTAALCICLWFPSRSNPFLPYQRSNRPSSNSGKDELDLALEDASMPNKTVIITVVNKAYVEQSVDEETTMLDLFLESFWFGEGTRPLLDHLLVVTVDQAAHERCKFKRLHCYRLVTEGVDFGGEKVYMSKDYIKMTWRRTLLLLDVLKRGYSFIFTDTDILWLRNPFAKLSPNQMKDLQISVDSFIGDPRPEHNFINTGFYYIKSNNKTISLYDTWYSQKDHFTGKNDQQVLQELMHDGLFTRLDLQVRFLETRHFSGFCQESRDVATVTTVHANCCRHISAKFGDLTVVLYDWKRFKAAMTKHPADADNIIRGFKWSAHTGCKNSWKER
ncbi:uncharacterized protein At1g28695-like [Durio zibethinus]|uniref:Uncharacterized protein At1g28695-like n=1 Tax=Durio zibethinus TaxID=66656 RepID=A0A6P5WVM0_DURZI|nr:uncharacterized protein At1g28695-like [Durio zibethinus]